MERPARVQVSKQGRLGGVVDELIRDMKHEGSARCVRERPCGSPELVIQIHRLVGDERAEIDGRG